MLKQQALRFRITDGAANARAGPRDATYSCWRGAPEGAGAGACQQGPAIYGVACQCTSLQPCPELPMTSGSSCGSCTAQRSIISTGSYPLGPLAVAPVPGCAVIFVRLLAAHRITTGTNQLV